MKSTVYKAQWPQVSTGTPMVLIYPDATRSPWIQIPATDEIRRALFSDQFIKVYFRGRIIGDSLEIEQFVRQSEWL